jgi:hypothetical protein
MQSRDSRTRFARERDSWGGRNRCGALARSAKQGWGERSVSVGGNLVLELANGGDHDRVREDIFSLLGLALEREPMRLTTLAFETDDAYLRGTALE